MGVRSGKLGGALGAKTLLEMNCVKRCGKVL